MSRQSPKLKTGAIGTDGVAGEVGAVNDDLRERAGSRGIRKLPYNFTQTWFHVGGWSVSCEGFEMAPSSVSNNTASLPDSLFPF